jgi:hypothetical protein
MHDERLTGHVPTSGVRLRDDGLLVYGGLAATNTAAHPSSVL